MCECLCVTSCTVSVFLPLCLCLEAAHTGTGCLWIQAAGPGLVQASANCGGYGRGQEGGYQGPRSKLNL